MALYLAIVAFSIVCANSAVISRQTHHIEDSYSILETAELVKRDNAVATNGPLMQDFDLKSGNSGEEVLVQRVDGLLITCTDCKVQGQFALEMDFAIDENLLSELSAVLVPQLSALEGPALSAAISIVTTGVAGASSVAGQVAPIATSIVQKASNVAHSVAASAASLVMSAVAEATADAASIVSKADDKIKSALGGLFDRRSPHIIPRDTDALIFEILKGFNITVTQQTPIVADFNLGIRTGSQAIEVDLPTVAFGGLLVSPPSIISLGIFELQMVLSPLAFTSTISMQSNMNVSLSFGAGLALKEPLRISGSGLQGTDIEATSRFSGPMVIAQEPTLCVTATLGPVIKFTLSIPSANVGVDLEAQLEIPRISTCFEQAENVDDECQPNGSITRAVRINSTSSIGIRSEIGLFLPAGLDAVLPDPPQLPQISAVFPRFDKCLELGATN